MDRLEVLKVINKALLSRPGAVERFLREIRAAAKLTHANVVTAYSAVQQGDLLAFAMEYVEGQDLARLVKAQGQLPIAHACFYAQQVAWGLQHAHEKQMVHRDIKPQNLMLARDGAKHVVKILDFGLAKATREKGDNLVLTRVGQMLGTPDYIAPEQTVDAAGADIRADIYSLGCTLYYLLAGRPPFLANGVAGVLLAHQMDEAEPLNRVRPEVPEGVAKVVSKMMAKEPAKRFQTPSDVANALSKFVKSPAARRSDPAISVPQAQPPGKGKQQPAPPRIEAIAAAPPKPAVPKVESPFAFDTAMEPPPTSAAPRTSRQAPVGIGASKQRSARIRLLLLAGGGMAACLVIVALIGLLVFLLGGTLRVQTPDGILVVDNVPSGAKVSVDGRRVTLDAGDGNPIEIHVVPGKKHELKVQCQGFRVWGETVEVSAGKRLLVRATLVPLNDPQGGGTAGRPDDPQPKNTPTIDLIASMKFVHVPKGTFWMGGGSVEGPPKAQVTIANDYEIAAYCVTQEQWETVMGDNPSWFCRTGGGRDQVATISDAELKRYPVESVSWQDTQRFLARLKNRQQGNGWTYRLPTEAEWEYACRGAAKTRADCSWDFYICDRKTNDLSSEEANFNGSFPAGNAAKGKYLARPAKVGSYLPNPLGLYDMHGNLWQWCDDLQRPSGQLRAVRGGGWNENGGRFCRAAWLPRGHGPLERYNRLGFRVVRVSASSTSALPTADKPPTPSVSPTAAQSDHAKGADARITASVAKGIQFLRRRQAPNGSWKPGADLYVLGCTALAGIALLESGLAADDPALRTAAQFVRNNALKAGDTYQVSLAVLFLDRLSNPKDRPMIKTLAVRLLAGQLAGGEWTYSLPDLADADSQECERQLRVHWPWTKKHPRPAGSLGARVGADSNKSAASTLPGLDLDEMPAAGLLWNRWRRAPAGATGDNSNTKFAIMAIWAARRHGVPAECPILAAYRRFSQTQQIDDGWPYTVGQSKGTMTCAGLLGLATGQGLRAELSQSKTKVQDPAIERGLLALAKHIGVPSAEPEIRPALPNLYFLWSVESIAMLYDLKTIGGKDWYAWGAQALVVNQQKEGQWTMGGYPGANSHCDTCFAILFLERSDLLRDLTNDLRASLSLRDVVPGGENGGQQGFVPPNGNGILQRASDKTVAYAHGGK